MTTPTERDALIARIRNLERIHGKAGGTFQEIIAMLAADAQEIARTRNMYEKVVQGRADFRQALRDARGAQQVAVPQAIDVTPEMVEAYLTANSAYWIRTDELPKQDAGKWRNGTPREATAEALRAALKAAPQPPQAERVPMTEAELEDGFNSPGVDVAPTDSVESVFIEGARFAERHHGIGEK